MRPSSLASSLPPFLPSATYRAKPLLATHSTILLLFPRTNSSSVARESDATVGSKARKIFALRNRPCRVNEQAATYTRAHAHAHTRSGAWLIPPNGGASVSRTVSHSSRQSFVSFQIYRPAPPSLPLSLENKYLSPRFNPCPQNQFAAAEDLAIFDPQPRAPPPLSFHSPRRSQDTTWRIRRRK